MYRLNYFAIIANRDKMSQPPPEGRKITQFSLMAMLYLLFLFEVQYPCRLHPPQV